MSVHRLSLTVVVSIVGSLYFVGFATTLFVGDYLRGPLPFFDYIHIPFIIMLGIGALAVWFRPKTGYVICLVTGVVGILVLSPFTFAKGVSSPADIVLFFYVITVFPLMLGAVLYSLIGFLDLRNPLSPVLSKTSVIRPVIIILILGFMIGGSTVGFLAGNTESQLLTSSNASADVNILLGAHVQGNTAYSPGHFNTTVGKSVTWLNKDNTVHTVTSRMGLFDSGSLNPRQSWSHSFTAGGVYKYYCTIHSWMNGTITIV